MKLSLRSYPHPVVGNQDDVPGAAFQATMDMSSDKENIYIDVSIANSSSTIKKLISAGQASHVVHVECSNTLFRRAQFFNTSTHRETIAVDKLNAAVEVNVFVIATKDVSGYRVDKAHSDYGSTAFEVRKGDILATAEGQVFHIESNFDSLSRMGSIMQIQQANEDGDLPMRVDFTSDKIIIILSKKDFADYKLLKSSEGVSGPLTTTIVLPVLLEALHLLNEDEDGEDSLRWMRALRRRISALSLDGEKDLLVAAQKLLDFPVKRALASSRMLEEAASA